MIHNNPTIYLCLKWKLISLLHSGYYLVMCALPSKHVIHYQSLQNRELKQNRIPSVQLPSNRKRKNLLIYFILCILLG